MYINLLQSEAYQNHSIRYINAFEILSSLFQSANTTNDNDLKSTYEKLEQIFSLTHQQFYKQHPNSFYKLSKIPENEEYGGLIIIIDDFEMLMGGGGKVTGFPHISSILDKISINFLSIFDRYNEYTERLSVVGICTATDSPIPAPFLRAGRFHTPIALPILNTSQRSEIIRDFVAMRAIALENEEDIISILSSVNIFAL